MRLILAVCVWLSVNSLFAGNGGSLKFDKVIHDFGIIEENNGPVTHVFHFINNGRSPVRITNILTSCGCTTSDYTKTAINIGDSGFVKAIFDPKNRPGPFSRTLTVITNGTPDSYVLNVEGSVGSMDKELLAIFPHPIGNLRVTSNEVKLTVKEDKIDSFYIGVYNPNASSVTIRNVVTPYPMRTLAKNMMITPKDGENILITYNGALAGKLGLRTDTVYLVTNDDTLKNKAIIVKANIVQNFDRLTPAQLAAAPVFGVTQQEGIVPELYLGEKGSYAFEVENTGKTDLVIRGFHSKCNCMTASFEKGSIKKGSKGKLLVSFDSSKMHGVVIETITVITNAPKQTEKTFTLKSKVVVPGKEPFSN